MRQNKKVIGITGGSGVGKSYISDKLRELGYPVIDADKTAHESINRHECIKELTAFFGESIEKDGKIDRKILGKIVFSDPQKLEKLNQITHKYILDDIEAQIEKASSETVFVDGATLIESGMPCDKMIGVVADMEIRKNRIMARDNLTEEAAILRLSAQPKNDFYMKNCELTIENNGGTIDIESLLKRIMQ